MKSKRPVMIDAQLHTTLKKIATDKEMRFHILLEMIITEWLIENKHPIKLQMYEDIGR